MSEQSTRFDKIYNYIEQHGGCTKTEVIKKMKGISALATTHKIIQQQIEEGKIVSKPDESNSQIHHLYVNDKDQFAIINEKIIKAEIDINALGNSKKTSDHALDAASWLLMFILIQANKLSDYDAKLLTGRILNSMLTVAEMKLQLINKKNRK